MNYKIIVNELDNFLKKKKKDSCSGCPAIKWQHSSIEFRDKLEGEFGILSPCAIRLFYKLKGNLSENKLIFLLKKLKENNIQYINCESYENSLPFIKVLESIVSNELEVE